MFKLMSKKIVFNWTYDSSEIHKWASAQDFGTYLASHTKRIETDGGSSKV